MITQLEEHTSSNAQNVIFNFSSSYKIEFSADAITNKDNFSYIWLTCNWRHAEGALFAHNVLPVGRDQDAWLVISI
jgi:hypothetical protein